jgi:uncharacterized protein DUF4252
MKLLFQKLRLPLIAIVLVMMAVFAAQAQDARIQTASLDHLAAKASESVDVNIDGRLLTLASKLLSDKDADEKEVKELIAGIKGIYVKSFEFEADGQYTPADIESIRSQLRTPWTKLVNVTSKKDGSLEVYVLLNGDAVGGLTVIAADEREFTVVNIVGPVDLNKLAKLEGQFGVPDLGIESKPAKPKKDQ